MNVRGAVEDLAVGAAAAVTVHGLLEHFVNIGWTVAAGLATASAVAALRALTVRFGPPWAARLASDNRPPSHPSPPEQP